MVIFRLFKMAAAAILDFQNLKFLRVKPRLVEKFRKFLFADVGKSELGKNKKETCAKHKIDRSQNGRSNNID